MACNGIRSRIQDVFIHKQVNNNKDEFEAPVADDYVRLDNGYQSQATPEEIERDIIKGSYTPEATLSGIKIATMGGSTEMYGADYSDGVTKPRFDPFLTGIGMVSTKVQSLPIDTITTNGVHDAVLTGAISGATALLVVPTYDADTVINVIPIAGTFQAETLNGDDGSEISISSGTLTDAGWSYEYDTDSCERYSLRSQLDGFKSEMYNAVPTVVLTVDAGNIPRFEWEFAGVIRSLNDVFQWMRDDGTPLAVSNRDLTVPPIYQDARFRDSDFVPIVDGTTSIDFGIVRGLFTNANSAGGVEGYGVTGRSGVFSHRIAIPTNAELDVLKSLFDASDFNSEFRIGQTQYNTFWSFIRGGKLKPVVVEDEQGFAKFALQSTMSGQDDKEYRLVCI